MNIANLAALSFRRRNFDSDNGAVWDVFTVTAVGGTPDEPELKREAVGMVHLDYAEGAVFFPADASAAGLSRERASVVDAFRDAVAVAVATKPGIGTSPPAEPRRSVQNGEQAR